ncbi:MAG: DUF5916 domain-containing protein [Proteobacteria bacterium]|nr:DUF5916 domain-containing protein [Pseudomonadota bacterium]
MKLLVRTIVALLCAVSVEVTLASPQARATRLGVSPTLDGEVLTDHAWSQLTPITAFTQQRPGEGMPASKRTEVYVGFMDDALFVGVVCYDETPSLITVTNQNRDASLNDTDSFRMVIDAFQSGQHGLIFGTNPTGLEYDGQVSNETGSRFGNGGFDLNWDTTWQAEAAIGAHGWSAEMRIPFSSLRYPAGDIQQWGFNFERTIRRSNEVTHWAPLPRQYAMNRVSLAGAITGIEVPPQRNFIVTPYALSRQARGGNATRDKDTEFGLDAKYSITPSLTLDATINTDFAQVEVDSQQVNLNRFSLFFPEKRPFFQENSSQFRVGASGVELFFSRRIGIGPGGVPLPIAGGLRLSGKAGPSTNVGLLAMRSKAVPGIAPENDFAVVRLRQELSGRSAVGMLFVGRDGGGSDNQTWAVDGRWGVGEKVTLAGLVAKTSTPGITDDDHAYNLHAAYDTKTWSFNTTLTEVGNGFNPEVGFLSRKNFRRLDVFGLRSIRAAESSAILEYKPHASYTGYWDFDGFYETGRWHFDSSIEWKNGGELHTAVNLNHEGVKAPFEISSGVFVAADSYDETELSVFASTDRSAAIRTGFGLNAGGFFGGERLGLSPYVAYRPNEAFEASVSWNYNDIRLPGGDFDVGLTNVRISYSFSSRMSFAALLQHNDRDQVLATNLRFSWLQDANTGLHIVYNETDDDINAPGRPRREFIIKYSHQLSVY